MRNLIILLISTLTLTALLGCEKTKEKIQYNLIMNAITNGQWKMTSYTKGGTDITTDFAPYTFQFKDNFTVDAIKNGAVESAGTWNADTAAATLTANFPTAGYPVNHLTGVWNLVDNSWTYVIAELTTNGEYRKLRIDKK